MLSVSRSLAGVVWLVPPSECDTHRSLEALVAIRLHIIAEQLVDSIWWRALVRRSEAFPRGPFAPVLCRLQCEQ